MINYELPPLLNPLPKNISEEYEIHIANTDKINEVINNLKDIIPKFLKNLPFSKLPYEIHEKTKEINEEEDNSNEDDNILIKSIMEEEDKEYTRMISEIINNIKSNLSQLNKPMNSCCDELKKEYITNYGNKKYKLLENNKSEVVNMKYKSINELSNENESKVKIEMNNLVFDKKINEIINKYTLSPTSNTLLNMKMSVNKGDNSPILISLNVFESMFLNNENGVLYPIGFNKYTHQKVYENVIISKFNNPQSFYQFYYQNLIFQSLLENNKKMYLYIFLFYFH